MVEENHAGAHPDAPPPHRILLFDSVFSAEECERILDIGRALDRAGRLSAGRVDAEQSIDSMRDVAIAFLAPDESTAWIFQRLGEILAQANQDAYRFDIDGFHQGVQISRYSPGQHYGWHLDIGPGAAAGRKLSLTLQLSDPQDYDGGNLEFRVPDLAAGRARGSMTVFPSWAVHRVAPVRRGERWSLVSWVSGPPFR